MTKILMLFDHNHFLQWFSFFLYSFQIKATKVWHQYISIWKIFEIYQFEIYQYERL